MANTYQILQLYPLIELGYSTLLTDIASITGFAYSITSNSYTLASNFGENISLVFQGNNFIFDGDFVISGEITSLSIVEVTLGVLTEYSFSPAILAVDLSSALYNVAVDPASLALQTLFGAETATHTGTAGADFFEGTIGHDIMIGGNGNDSYTVTEATDIVTETQSGALGGIDIVTFFGETGTFVLGLNVENLRLGYALTSVDFAINGTGNNLANSISGNSESNVISGLNGNDILDGAGGSDTLIGGNGNDTYYADQIGDIITETSSSLAVGGNDLVYFGNLDPFATIVPATYQLTVYVENLTLVGIDANNGRGNAVANVLTGNGAANALYGGGGNDILDGGEGVDLLAGGFGNDTYYVDNIDDLIVESSPFPTTGGTDIVYFSGSEGAFTLSRFVENLTLVGSDDIAGIGNSSKNAIIGNSGNNELSGASGNDTLTGGAGSDVFIFNTALNQNGNVDVITDYSVVDDLIGLDHTFFSGVGASVDYLSEIMFKNISLAGAVVDTNDRIIYNQTTGALSYDSDGSGTAAAVRFATVNGSPLLTFDDFFVY